ncbi:ead/Ea22-like family protein [Citrobacter braakii]|uniref:ead/Ea22-like family protein n=1 Tax=Citrobacter braakii TaxID=57706 RepID=UPI0030801102
MTALNKQALREAAENATAGQWVVELGDEVYAVDGDDSEQIAMVFSDNGRSDAAFIAAASPVAVLSLLDENLQLQRDKDSLEAVAIAMRDDMRDAREKLEAAEKRIAELEASHSRLRDTMATIHNTIRMDGGYTPLAAILNAAKRAHEESAIATGIGVKGE